VILVSAICFLVARLAHWSIGEPVLRAVGLGLLTVAASSSFYCLWPYKIYSFTIGSGGVIGVGAVEFLRGHFALLGTFILIAATWIVGTILLADTFLLMIFGWLSFAFGKIAGMALPVWSAARQRSEVLSEIWRRLSVRSIARVPQSIRPVGSEAEPIEEEETGGLKLISRPLRKVNEPYAPTSYEDYILPPLELLAEPEHSFASVQGKVVKAKAAALEKLLSEFNVNARVVTADTGPVVTMFELELAAGVKVSQIANSAPDVSNSYRDAACCSNT